MVGADSLNIVVAAHDETENPNIDACIERDIRVPCAPSRNRNVVADHTVVMLSVTTRC